ncbi:MAG: nucleotidyltransferase domain-containing protein [Kiritimatiellae bacterium]|nr:nucleotidyltransferase domain-containing protein [Kiritimatiellia bacterium]
MAELTAWARRQRELHSDVSRIGLFGSYATGTYAPGSDVDVVILLRSSDEPRRFARALRFDTADLSVGTDLFVYTEAEANAMEADSPWFRHVLSEIIWME